MQNISKAQGLCDANNRPAGSIEGAFEIEGNITAGCTPLAVKLHDKSGGTDIRYDFYYDGSKDASLLDMINNKDSSNNALFSNANSIRVYKILQYGTKNGKPMYTCKTISVRPNNQPIFSYNSCNNNSVEINIPVANDNDFDYYEINWGDGAILPEKINKNSLPYSKTKSLILPKTIKVEGFFNNSKLNCASPASITIPFKIPTLFPNGYDDPNKVNIDKIELVSPNEAKISFHGSFDSKGYELFEKEQGKAYKSKGKNYTPGDYSIELEDSTKSYCFYLDRITSCGSDPSAELCTLPLFSVDLQEKNNNLKWSTYPNTITSFDDRNYGRYLDKSQKIIEIENTVKKEIVVNKNLTTYTKTNVDCSKQQCYRIEMETSGQLYYYKYSGISISNKICVDRKTFSPPSINDVYVTVKNENTTEIIFQDDSQWKLLKEQYFLFKKNENKIDSTDYIKPLLDINAETLNNSECYFMKYKDECGSLSEPSPLVCSINLTANINDELIWTSFNPFGNDSIESYEIISINEITKNESNIAKTKNGETDFKPNLDNFETEANFKIRSISQNGKESYSNNISIPIEAIFFVPDIFSPDGNNVNDSLQIKGRFGRVTKMYMSIYNLWGEKIYEFNQKDKAWNGKINGKNAQEGIYIYYLKIILNNNEEIIKKGRFQLIR
ncbi:gliding motility-associated C-terminal domain-containing protein [Lacihabitans sp. LS3-19]|uniref:T9SS type B sorting domain-containing protein n=1 Tax=Lacihabitans sp. LS3-19 TaxID=2487335 RepID=UPI0020CC2EFA|nr:gliding motility-associated C-terminal domain-containing protein [Lacihabitans sp. LS3-19]